VLTSDDTVEMKACVMEGATLRCGAVSGLSTVTNAVSLARLVMEKTPHIYLVEVVRVQRHHPDPGGGRREEGGGRRPDPGGEGRRGAAFAGGGHGAAFVRRCPAVIVDRRVWFPGTQNYNLGDLLK
jgi:hypothetical protein